MKFEIEETAVDKYTAKNYPEKREFRITCHTAPHARIAMCALGWMFKNIEWGRAREMWPSVPEHVGGRCVINFVLEHEPHAEERMEEAMEIATEEAEISPPCPFCGSRRRHNQIVEASTICGSCGEDTAEEEPSFDAVMAWRIRGQRI